MGRSGRVWSVVPPQPQGRIAQHNIIRTRQGRKPGINPVNEKESFEIFAHEMIDEAVIYSNLQGRRAVRDFNVRSGKVKVWDPISTEEMKAFIGLHIIAGVCKAQYRHTEELWSERDGLPIFRATMPRCRFTQIKAMLRFDDRRTRSPEDPFSPIRHVFNIFVKQLSRFYEPSSNLTLDEQLMEFHGRVKFKQYIPSKPGKFGLKFFWLCDAESCYVLNGIPYVGEATLSAAERQEYSSFSETLTMKIMTPYLRTGRNVTTDNWFTSCQLAESLLQNRTTIVGTIRKNNRDIPPVCKTIAGRQKKDAVYYYSGSQCLLSFWDKAKSPVLLLSTMHKPPFVAGNKPEIVCFYNKTKSGVDNMDRQVRYYSSKRKCSRWPYSVFMNLVDIAGINASVLFKSEEDDFACTQRREFLKNVGYQLVHNHILHRMAKNMRYLKAPTVRALHQCGYKLSNEQEIQVVGRKRCSICPRTMDKKTKFQCTSCGCYMCLDHRAMICKSCSQVDL